MRDALFHVERSETQTLQGQIREALVSAILSGQMRPGDPVPSTRAMAHRLGVSRNTVVLSYQALCTDGFLTARERSGFYVAADVLRDLAARAEAPVPLPADPGQMDWHARMAVRPALQHNIARPPDWQAHPFPFVYGQSDEALFPITEWRDCVRQALGRRWLDDLTSYSTDTDDPMLIDQIRRRILPRRGIRAGRDEVLVTMGAQNAVYLLADLLVTQRTAVGFEDPGYVEARNIFALRTSRIRPIPVDAEGVAADARLTGLDVLFVTPSHQFPTMVTLSTARRKALLAAAVREDFIIIEDDYEFETNYTGAPSPALKSSDTAGRVLYVGSLSKSMVPGIRMGFMVGPAAVIREARALRRLMLRNPPLNNQRAVALFLSLGHHDALIARLHRTYKERWEVMRAAIARHLPAWHVMPGSGGTAVWIAMPEGVDGDALAAAALGEGIVIDPTTVLFAGPALGMAEVPRNFLRLGFSAIATDQIEPGIAKLAIVAERFSR